MALSSTDRVAAALAAAGLNCEIVLMPASTRTADDAAKSCGCDPARIVKSLVFEGKTSGKLILLLVSGQNQVDIDHVRHIIGETLSRADPKRVREETGFAIGGVAPVGHINPLPVYMDQSLLDFETIWAAAGAPNAVFDINPKSLRQATGATVISVTPSQ